MLSIHVICLSCQELIRKCSDRRRIRTLTDSQQLLLTLRCSYAQFRRRTFHEPNLIRIWGFAKSRPTAQRPAANARDGPKAGNPAARKPSGPVLIFHSFFLSSLNSRACTVLHRIWASKINDGEYEFVYHFNSHLNPCFCLLHVVEIKTFSFPVHSFLYRNR